MSRKRTMLGVVVFAVAGVVVAMQTWGPDKTASAEKKSRPARDGGSAGAAAEVGRYRFAPSPPSRDRLYVIDTATGRVWSKGAEEAAWTSEGNPARGKAAEDADAQKGPLTLALPDGGPVEMTVKQRRRQPVPGSGGRLHVDLDDITGGQVLVSVVADEEAVAPKRSLRAKETLTFQIQDKAYTLELKHLHNVAIGEDFAVITIRRGKPEKKR